MKISRRAMVGTSVGVAAAAFGGLTAWRNRNIPSTNRTMALVADPDSILDLPEGFSYRIVARTGSTMTDGLLRPGRPDGMACFAMPGREDMVILTSNHEIPTWESKSAFGEDDRLLDLYEGEFYGTRPDTGRPYHGGVTITHFNLATGHVERDFLALAGTKINCAGGATPWGSWLSCEETTDVGNKPHGFVFEVPALADGPVDPVPLKAMGRFSHEACAVDPASGMVYMTEDDDEDCFYRFIPDVPGRLADGGTLQALVLSDIPHADTSNGSRPTLVEGKAYAARWITLDDVEAPEADLARRAQAAGAAMFKRGEGIAYGHRPGGAQGDIFFTCTSGGRAGVGQVFRYAPDETGDGGTLTLFFESPGAGTMEYCDNLAVAPWGDLIVCEDGVGDQYLRGVTPEGRIYDFARNAHDENSEFCGACFAPDGKTMFVNIQEPGITLAITGPWETLRA
ncbi:alkaline phosphatase PhoX [Sphingomicrobium sediminis]|uniref:PhoX family protein n=1 Tax=Sphingomicrobium sediminis TaxID=2950949 RepID=A0A9X2J3U7_9SPHN|nr:alkaline phosphatase PhoX [Sphingomicrobium sediminis]MCM8558445.1 PhoX family protein [Sphingomicrobium sediminis]